MANVTANGMQIEYDIRGSGQPLLLIMGLGGQLVDWPDDFVDLFVDQGYQVIRFDNRDIGLSTKTDWEPPSQGKLMRAMLTRRALKGVGYTVTDMANDAAGLLGALNIEAAHIVGVSMGGMIAQEVAIQHSTKVLSLCSIMSHTGDRRNGGIAASLVAQIARQKAPTNENAVEQSVATFRAISGPHFDEHEFRVGAKVSFDRSFSPAGVARQTAAIAGSRDRTALLADVAAPTLVIHGLMDPLVKPSGGVATTRAIPSARMLAFGDMGHDLPRPRWHEMRDQIISNAQRSQTSLR